MIVECWARTGILAKYGGEEHLQAPPKEMLLSQTEHYVEYSRTGQVVKGQEPAVPRSKYEEDGTRLARTRDSGTVDPLGSLFPSTPRRRPISLTLVTDARVCRCNTHFPVYPNNHKSVWGSYWEAGQWGYACCGQNVKNSFCTGAAGFEARKRALIQGNQ